MSNNTRGWTAEKTELVLVLVGGGEGAVEKKNLVLALEMGSCRLFDKNSIGYLGTFLVAP